MKIKEINESERPREKMISMGPSGLSNGELLAVILRNGTKDESVLDLARRILSNCDDRLGRLFSMTPQQLGVIKGIGPCKAAEVMAVFELGKRFLEESSGVGDCPVVSARMVYDLLAPRLKGIGHEECRVLFLDSRNRLISQEQICVGNAGETAIDVPRILRRALDMRASGAILVHNHPAGNPKPSVADIELTKTLKAALNALSLSLLDHVIISDDRFFSFAEDRLYEK
ncbi:MAG: DNA repair protein RadC [Bacteroidales bacterium]|nr:DNA repair protein RadC [Bacteroidales bacterium]